MQVSKYSWPYSAGPDLLWPPAQVPCLSGHPSIAARCFDPIAAHYREGSLYLYILYNTYQSVYWRSNHPTYLEHRNQSQIEHHLNIVNKPINPCNKENWMSDQ